MKTFWILNRWDEGDCYDEHEDESSNLPGELMMYSDMKIFSSNDAGDSNIADRRVWREEDVFVGDLQKQISPSMNVAHGGGIHNC